jgi:shikimate kinase
VAVTGPLVVLVGPPGAGKTTVAVELAARLGVTVRDTDWDVERSSGSTIADLFVYRGEPVFRALEREAVLVALTDHSGVLAVGGGAVMDPIVEQAMAGHPVVFLDVQLPDAARWQQLMERRRPVYQRVAVARVPTDGLGPEAVADAVLAAMPTLAGHDPGPGTGR